jgi:hypothetical protein
MVQTIWANSSQDPISKIPTQKMAGGVVQTVECMPHKCEVLSSSPNTKKKERKKTWGKHCKIQAEQRQ